MKFKDFLKEEKDFKAVTKDFEKYFGHVNYDIDPKDGSSVIRVEFSDDNQKDMEKGFIKIAKKLKDFKFKKSEIEDNEIEFYYTFTE